MYHVLTPAGAHGGPSTHPRYCLPVSVLREQLGAIASHGFATALVGEIWSPPDRTGPVVGVTFDDGDASNYTLAFPALCEARMRADFFVNTATIGRPGSLTWSQIAEMQRAGLSFQSHSHDHVSLVGLGRPALESQLRDSKRLLEDRLGVSVDFLAAPYGLLNGHVVRTAREVGYRAVCSSRSWPARPGARTRDVREAADGLARAPGMAPRARRDQRRRHAHCFFVQQRYAHRHQ